MSILTVPTSSYRSVPSLLGSNVVFDLFNHFYDDFDSLQRKSVQGYPVADISTDDQGNTVLEFALAGFSRDDLSIEVKPEKQTITVASLAKDSDSAASRRIARRAFTKTFVNYNNNLDLAATTAKYENGLLTVTVPRRPEAKSLSINIG